MSKLVDAQRASDREAARLNRLYGVLCDLAKVTRLRLEGLPMDVIATRMGWHPATLYRWIQAAKVIERRGSKMSQGSTHS